MTGELPCSKEEAAALAGIQLRIEESWGRPIGHHTPLSPDDPNTLKPISEDKVRYNRYHSLLIRFEYCREFSDKLYGLSTVIKTIRAIYLKMSLSTTIVHQGITN